VTYSQRDEGFFQEEVFVKNTPEEKSIGRNFALRLAYLKKSFSVGIKY
jgi:hypothetical protein